MVNPSEDQSGLRWSKANWQASLSSQQEHNGLVDYPAKWKIHNHDWNPGMEITIVLLFFCFFRIGKKYIKIIFVELLMIEMVRPHIV